MAKTPKRTFDHIVFGALVSGAAAGAPVDSHALAGLATPAPLHPGG